MANSVKPKTVQVKEVIPKHLLKEEKEIQKAVKAFRKFCKPTKKNLINFYKTILDQQIAIIDNPDN